jgi:excisionase family DNA binding protein
MQTEELSFDKLPQAVSLLMAEVLELKALVIEANNNRKIPSKSRTPIGIEEACQITGKAKPTIYALVRTRVLPSYKAGKKLYFYEDELLKWIESGKRKTNTEMREEVLDYSQNNQSKRRSIR